MMRANIAMTRPSHARHVWVWAAVLSVGMLGAQDISAQAQAAKGKAASSQSASPDSAISSAIAHLEAGRTDTAVNQLSTAISSGKLPTNQMARALYYRGLAYRKQSKPAQAIADFTSALWIKDGLDGAQRNEALAQRAGAYREAGLTDQAEADEKRVAATGGSAARSASAATGAQRPARAETDAASTSTASASPQQSSSGGLGDFFGSLFGGSSNTQTAAAAPRQQATDSGTDWSTSAQRAGASSTSRTGNATPPSAVSSWTTGSTVTAAGPAAKSGSQQSTAERPVVRTAAASAAGRGSVHVQVAAVRSRSEAQAVIAKLAKLKTGGRDTSIEQAVMGNMGTLYQVRLGPFPGTGEARSVCGTLRKAGLDCLLVSK